MTARARALAAACGATIVALAWPSFAQEALGDARAPSTEADRANARAERLRALEARLAEREKSEKTDLDKLAWLERVKISGYVQPQLVYQRFNERASPNLVDGRIPPNIGANSILAKSNGTTTNPDFFRIRRARIKTELSPTDYARLVVEIDPNLAGGSNPASGTIARQVEAIGVVRWNEDTTTEFGMGIFKVPFSTEVVQPENERPFVERSAGATNMFPQSYDTGFRARTVSFDRKFRFTAAVLNGVTIGEKNFTVAPDLTRAKDFVGRAVYDFGPIDFALAAYFGHGQVVDATNLRFKQFSRYAGGFEANVHHTFVDALGPTRLYVEATLAQNMDRGLTYAFALPPVPTPLANKVSDLDERAFFVRIEQDVTEWVTLGFRYDQYSPDTAQKNNQRDTWSFVTAIHFTKGLQLALQADYAFDDVHRPGAQPTGAEIFTGSTVLQASF